MCVFVIKYKLKKGLSSHQQIETPQEIQTKISHKAEPTRDEASTAFNIFVDFMIFNEVNGP